MEGSRLCEFSNFWSGIMRHVDAPLSEEGIPAHAVPVVDHLDIEVAYRYAAYGTRGFQLAFEEGLPVD